MARNWTKTIASKAGVALALLAAAPSFARPVGELSEQATQDGWNELGGLVQFAGNLSQTIVRQANQGRLIAGAVASQEAVVIAPMAPSAQSNSSANKSETELAQESTSQSSGPDPRSVAGFSMPSFSPMQMPDIAVAPSSTGSLLRSPGLTSAPATTSAGYVPSGPEAGFMGSRGPAVLPKNDPSLLALKTARLASEAEMPKESKLRDESVGEQKDKKERKMLNQRAEKIEALEQALFDTAVTDLMGRPTPYTEKDYNDFRDFIAKQQERLGETNLTATTFREAAKQAYELHEEKDTRRDTADLKEAYRRFLSDAIEEGKQQLLEPKMHADPFMGPAISH